MTQSRGHTGLRLCFCTFTKYCLNNLKKHTRFQAIYDYLLPLHPIYKRYNIEQHTVSKFRPAAASVARRFRPPHSLPAADAHRHHRVRQRRPHQHLQPRHPAVGHGSVSDSRTHQPQLLAALARHRHPAQRHADSPCRAHAAVHQHGGHHMDAQRRGAHAHRIRPAHHQSHLFPGNSMRRVRSRVGAHGQLLEHHRHHRRGLHGYRHRARLLRGVDCRRHHIRRLFWRQDVASQRHHGGGVVGMRSRPFQAHTLHDAHLRARHGRGTPGLHHSGSLQRQQCRSLRRRHDTEPAGYFQHHSMDARHSGHHRNAASAARAHALGARCERHSRSRRHLHLPARPAAGA